MRSVVNIVMGCLVLCIIGCAGDGEEAASEKEDAVAKEIDKLQGDWLTVSFTVRGTLEEYPDVKVVTFKGNLVEGVMDKPSGSAGYELDVSSDPKQITLTDSSGETTTGFYALSGDELKLCFLASSDNAVPADFTSTKENGHVLLVLRRLASDGEAKPSGDAEAYVDRGDVWAEKDEPYKAIAEYNEAIKLDSKYAAAYYGRGRAWADDGEFDRAIADYTESIRLDPQHSLAYFDRGRLQSFLDAHDKAIEDFTKAIELDPSAAHYYYNRGGAWSTKGKNDEAIGDYTEAIRLDPSNAFSYYERGKAWRAKGERDKAIADYNEATRLNPRDARAYFNRGEALWNAGEKDKAEADFADAKRLRPDIAYSQRRELLRGTLGDSIEESSVFGTGTDYLDEGEFAKAIEAFTEYLKLKPHNATAYYYRGKAWHQQGEYEKSIEDFSKAITMFSIYAEAYAARGKAWEQLGDEDRAEADFKDAKRIDPSIKLDNE